MPRAFGYVALAGAIALAGSFNGVAAQESGPDTILLTGASLGGVKFSHKTHQDMTDCSSCHHESRPENPLTSEHQACTGCHTKTPTPPMVTSIRDAFHNATAKAGTCVDCHVTEAAAGKTVPLKCTECHKKENVAPGGR
ncbi:MAG TPA: cytochrome c3 family protein [Longimicrobiales bacterium]|nr:cytochrome c3 family protein [Longimicrobiales bacterium]